jgi:hypothetical protein
VHQVELLGGLRDRQPRPSRGGGGQKEDVALEDLRRVHAGKRPVPQQARHLARAAHHHHRLGSEYRAQPPPRARDDRFDARRRGVEQDVAAGDERGDVGAARARERIA